MYLSYGCRIKNASGLDYDDDNDGDDGDDNDIVMMAMIMM
jgi:hypothetical protein